MALPRFYCPKCGRNTSATTEKPDGGYYRLYQHFAADGWVCGGFVRADEEPAKEYIEVKGRAMGHELRALLGKEADKVPRGASYNFTVYVEKEN